MLLGNYSVLHKSPLKFAAGSTVSVEGQVRSNFGKSGSNRNRFYIDQSLTALSMYAVPTGYYPDATWIIPQKAGQISSVRGLSGSGSAYSANLAGGLNAGASLSGEGDVLTADGTMVLFALASLVGAGVVSAANASAVASLAAGLSGTGDASGTGQLQQVLQALANLSGTGAMTGTGQLGQGVAASANLSGSGSLTAAIGALSGMLASLAGAGSATGSTATAIASISSTITSYGSLTPEGIRDAVWNASSSSFTTAGGMGGKLNSAASGGVDYPALGAAVWNAADRTLTGGGSAPTAEQNAEAVWQHLVGASVEAKLAEVWARLGLDATKPLVTGDTSITFGDIVMALSEANGAVTLERQ